MPCRAAVAGPVAGQDQPVNEQLPSVDALAAAPVGALPPPGLFPATWAEIDQVGLQGQGVVFCRHDSEVQASMRVSNAEACWYAWS